MRVLQVELEPLQPLGPNGTIDHPVITTQSHVHAILHPILRQSLLLLALLIRHEHFRRLPYRQNRCLRRVYHSHELVDTKHSQVRDRERPPNKLARLQLVHLRFVREFLRVRRDLRQPFRRRVKHDRRDQTRLRRHCNADVSVLELPNELSEPLRVHLRNVF